MDLPYDFAIVGGPFDGAPGMQWLDDGKHPPPDLIFVSVCGKGRDCGSSSCRPSAKHIAYWTPDEERPRDAISYRKQSEHVERCEAEACIVPLHGKAVYAIGGLLDPRNFGTVAREPVTA